MKVELRIPANGKLVGELDLQPSNLRRLREVDYLDTKYVVAYQQTDIIRGEPVAVLWVNPA